MYSDIEHTGLHRILSCRSECHRDVYDNVQEELYD
jgi:hypothetical protein